MSINAATAPTRNPAIRRISLADVSRDQWLADRLRYIGASEVAIVCGEAQWGSAAALFAEKKGLRPPQIDTGVLRRGRWGEAAVFEALADERPEWEIRRAKVHVVNEETRCACTPDGFALAPDREGMGIVQAKVVSRAIFRQKWLYEPDDNAYGEATPPISYVMQTLKEMELNELSWGVLAVLINGEYDWTFRLFDVERNPVLEDRINYNVAEFFRRYLDPGIMPPFEPQRDEQLVKALYPKDDGTSIDLTADNRAIALVDELIETQAACKRMQAQEKAIKTELQGKLGESTYGLLPDGRCLSWKHQHRKAYTVEAADFRVLRILKNTPEQA
jgi:predicted phage-related endonuclease